MNIGRSKRDPVSLDGELGEFAGQLLDDQAEWLDQAMKRILPAKIYNMAIKDQENPILAKYFKDKKIVLHHVPDQLGLQIKVDGQIVARFTPRIAIDKSIQVKKEDQGWSIQDN